MLDGLSSLALFSFFHVKAELRAMSVQEARDGYQSKGYN